MHSHGHVDPRSTTRRLVLALGLTLGFVALEAGAGFWSNSLALLTDAAHNFSDALALGLSWWALRLSLRPANDNRTYGYHRAGILAALANAAMLIGISLLIAFEAVQRLSAPPEVHEQVMVVIGIIAFVINAGIALSLFRASREDLNIRSAFLHMAGDAASVLGVILAGIGIAWFGWEWLDPVASLLIAALIVWSAWGILRETVDILLESTPRDVDMNAMVADMRTVRGVRGVHDLHVWSIAANLHMLSAHVLTDNMSIAEGAQVQRELNERLLHDYNIGHTALQLEAVNCDPEVLYCELTTAGQRNCSCQEKEQWSKK